jgi:outer membrane protein assembly factor BamB
LSTIARFTILSTALLVVSMGPSAIAGNDEVRTVWTSFFKDPGPHRDVATGVAFLPRGHSLFVAASTAQGTRPNRTVGVTTIRYDQTGRVRWVAREDLGPTSHRVALVAATSQHRVIVTSSNSGSIVTVAYSAWTGARLWRSGFAGPEGAIGYPRGIALSPDGGTAYVTGQIDEDYGTIAYDTSTGASRWVVLEPHGAATAVAASPAGDRVFVTGVRHSAHQPNATFAYDAETGQSVWKFARPSRGLALSPDGSRLYLSDGPTALRTSDGSAAWSGLQRDDFGDRIAMGPRGLRIYVARTTEDGSVRVVALTARTGTRRWTTPIVPPFLDLAGMAATSRGVFLVGEALSAGGAGSDSDIETVSVSAESGTERWRARFGRPDTPEEAAALAVSPHGARVVVTGTRVSGDVSDLATLSYSA